MHAAYRALVPILALSALLSAGCRTYVTFPITVYDGASGQPLPDAAISAFCFRGKPDFTAPFRHPTTATTDALGQASLKLSTGDMWTVDVRHDQGFGASGRVAVVHTDANATPDDSIPAVATLDSDYQRARRGQSLSITAMPHTVGLTLTIPQHYRGLLHVKRVPLHHPMDFALKHPTHPPIVVGHDGVAEAPQNLRGLVFHFSRAEFTDARPLWVRQYHLRQDIRPDTIALRPLDPVIREYQPEHRTSIPHRLLETTHDAYFIVGTEQDLKDAVDRVFPIVGSDNGTLLITFDPAEADRLRLHAAHSLSPVPDGRDVTRLCE